jgi:hypothetical protein
MVMMNTDKQQMGRQEYFDVGKAFLEIVKSEKKEWKEWLVGKGEHAALDNKLPFFPWMKILSK